MKTHLIVLILVLLAGNVAAQTRMTIAVPFEFVVNGTTLPAGHYKIIADAVEPVCTVQNTDSGQAVLVKFRSLAMNPKSASTGSDSKLIFTQTNGKHVLHQVCVAGESRILDLLHGTDVPEPVVP